MNQPKISVIITYNNYENSIKDCINSVLNQSFFDIEIICVNSGSVDSSENIVKEIASLNENIKLISLPNNDDYNFAKQVGLGIVSSEFVIFIDGCEVLSTDYIKDKFFEITKHKIKNIENNHLYRRVFLENDTEIASIIQSELSIKLEESAKKVKEQKAEIKEEFNKFYQNNVETIKNNTYEVVCRFNQLEKLFYEKDYEYRTKIDDFVQNAFEQVNAPTKQIYEDISKVYDYINSEINKKGCEINAVYEEITKNYNYTEELIGRKEADLNKLYEEKNGYIWQKLSELEREIVIRYVNLKRLFDMQVDEINSKIQLSDSSVDVVSSEKFVSENINKIYLRLNEISSLFYEELSKIYKEINEKIAKKSEEDRCFFEQKISELRSEFDTKLQNLKEEITGK